jgi:hypothetical protein
MIHCKLKVCENVTETDSPPTLRTEVIWTAAFDSYFLNILKIFSKQTDLNFFKNNTNWPYNKLYWQYKLKCMVKNINFRISSVSDNPAAIVFWLNLTMRKVGISYISQSKKRRNLRRILSYLKLHTIHNFVSSDMKKYVMFLQFHSISIIFCGKKRQKYQIHKFDMQIHFLWL